MKPLTLGLAALLALVIGWLAWKSQGSGAPPVTAQSTDTSAATTSAAISSVDRAPDSSPASVPAQAQSQTVGVSPAQVSATVDSAQILAQVRVTDEQGEPMSSFGVQWIDDDGALRDSDGAAGSSVTPGLHPGHYLAVLWGTELAREEHDVMIAARPESQSFDFVAHAQPAILVRVVETDGSPLLVFKGKRPAGSELPSSSLFVAATRRAPPSKWDEALNTGVQYSECGMFYTRRTPMRGAEIMDATVLGSLRLLEPPPLHVSIFSGNVLVATQHIEAAPRKLLFMLDAAAIAAQRGGVRVRMLEAEGGTPLGGVTVFLEGSATLLDQRTAADGLAQFPNLTPGLYLLQCVAEGRVSEMREIEIEPGQSLELGDIPLRTGEPLRVRFEYPGPEHPATNFVVARSRPGTPFGTLAQTSGNSFQSDPLAATAIPFPGQGAFELRVLSVDGPGGSASAHLGALPQRLVFGDAPQAEILVQLRTTTDVCLRAPRESKGISRWLVSTADGVPCRRVRIEGRAPIRIELVPSAYTVARLDAETKALGKAQAFSVGTEFVSVELQP